MFLVGSLMKFRFAMMNFISASAAAKSSALSIYWGEWALIIGNIGITPKPGGVGTSSSSVVLSMTFKAVFQSIREDLLE